MAGPIRSPRKIYKIELISTNEDDVAGVDNLPGAPANEAATTRAIFVKMKKAVGEWLGLTPVPSNDPAFTGVFAAGGLNEGATYRKRLGGFREASYTLIAETVFTIPEIVISDTGEVTNPDKKLKTISIGFPKGHSVTEIIAWISSTARASEISGIRSPSGALTPLDITGAP